MPLHHLVLVRHGETVGESSIRYHGRNDVALSEAGREQMRRVAKALAQTSFGAVYTSELQRTVQAAWIIAPGVPARAIAGFNEICFGEWEGLTREEIEARDPQAYERWREALYDFTYPAGDSVAGFRARVSEAFRRLLHDAPERALIVAHKGVISAIATELLGLRAEERTRWPADLASIHILAACEGRWQATVVNKTDHLE
jgi:broad specificity phosphatase PhoE